MPNPHSRLVTKGSMLLLLAALLGTIAGPVAAAAAAPTAPTCSLIDLDGAIDRTAGIFAFGLNATQELIIHELELSFVSATVATAIADKNLVQFFFRATPYTIDPQTAPQGWTPVPVTFMGRRGARHLFRLNLRVPAETRSSISIDASFAGMSVRYSASPFAAGKIVPLTATRDDNLQFGAGYAFDPGYVTAYGPRYFNGIVRYCVPAPGETSCGCVDPPPNPVGLLPFDPAAAAASVAPASASGRAARAGTAAELAAALADTTVSLITLVRNVKLSRQLVVPPGRAITIVGSTDDCVETALPDPYYDYEQADYLQPERVPPSDTPLPGMCTLNAELTTRLLNVSAGANVTIVAVALINGRADSGGAVYADAGASLSLVNCTVAGSAAVGATGRGGGIFFAGGDSARPRLFLSGTLMRDNTAPSGGDVFAGSGSSVAVVGSMLNNSHASTAAACVFLDSSGASSGSLLEMRDTVVYNYADRFLVAQGSTNYFPQRGGAFYVGPNAHFHAAHTRLIGMFNAANGGIIYLDRQAFLVMESSLLASGGAVSSGGGIYASPGAMVALISTQLTGCSAKLGNGGAVYLGQKARLFALSAPGAAANCSISGNSVDPTTGLGGAVFGEKQASAWLSACDVSFNSAFRGAGVFVSGGDRRNNRALAPSGIFPFAPGFLEALATDPAWPRFAVPDSVNLLVTIIGMNASTLTVNTASVQGLTALVQWDAFASRSTFYSNKAADNGGAFYCEAESRCGARDTDISFNSARSGAAVFTAASAAQVSLIDCVASGNAVAEFGGAAFINQVDLVAFTRTRFANNTCGIGGGAAFFSRSTVETTDCAFLWNKAAGLYPKGGAVNVREGTTWVARGCTFSGNAVGSPAAGATAAADQTGASSVILVETQGAFSGGAVYAWARGGVASRLAFSATIFDRNAAPLGSGGALAADGPVTVASANGTAWRRNSAKLGGAFALDDASQALTFTSDCAVQSNTAEVGAVLLTTAAAEPAWPAGNGSAGASAGGGVSGNAASNYGPVSATLPVSWQVTLPPTCRTSTFLKVRATLADAFNQTVREWRDASVVVSSTELDGQLLSGITAVGFSSGVASFDNLVIKGSPLSSYRINVTISSPTVTLANPVITAETAIEPCRFGERISSGLQCECIENALASPTLGGLCHCYPGFFLAGPDGEAAVVEPWSPDGKSPAVPHNITVPLTCKTCPSGGLCPGDNNLYSAADHWHASPSSTRFYSCDIPETCLSQAPAELGAPRKARTCRQGHQGLLCSICEPGYAYQGQYCRACPAGAKFTSWPMRDRVGLFLGMAAVVCILTLWMVWPVVDWGLGSDSKTARERLKERAEVAMQKLRERTKSVSRRVRTTGVSASRVSHASFASKDSANGLARRHPSIFDWADRNENENFSVFMRQAGTRMRLVIEHAQILAVCSHTMKIPWPGVLFRIGTYLNFLNIGFNSLPSIACMSPGGHFTGRFVGTVAPFFFFFAWILVCWGLGLALCRLRRWPDAVRKDFSDNCLWTLIQFLVLTYTPVTSTIISAFGCREIDGKYWLNEDLGQNCDEFRWTPYPKSAIFCIIFVAGGVPVFFIALLVHFRIPQKAWLKHGNAGLRAAINWCYEQQLPMPQCEALKVTDENIDDELLDTLYRHVFARRDNEPAREMEVFDLVAETLLNLADKLDPLPSVLALGVGAAPRSSEDLRWRGGGGDEEAGTGGTGGGSSGVEADTFDSTTGDLSPEGEGSEKAPHGSSRKPPHHGTSAISATSLASVTASDASGKHARVSGTRRKAIEAVAGSPSGAEQKRPRGKLAALDDGDDCDDDCDLPGSPTAAAPPSGPASLPRRLLAAWLRDVGRGMRRRSARKNASDLSRKEKLQEVLRWSAFNLVPQRAEWEEEEVVSVIGDLYAHCFVHVWYFTIIEFARKFILASIVGVLPRGTAGQALFAFVLASLFFQVFTRWRPFSRRNTRFVASLSSGALAVWFFVALLIKLRVNWAGPTATPVIYAVIIVITTLVPFIYPFILLHRAFRNARFKKQRHRPDSRLSLLSDRSMTQRGSSMASILHGATARKSLGSELATSAKGVNVHFSESVRPGAEPSAPSEAPEENVRGDAPKDASDTGGSRE